MDEEVKVPEVQDEALEEALDAAAEPIVEELDVEDEEGVE